MLSRDEALALATKLDRWPAGLGFALEPAPTPRGWRRLRGYRPFGPPPPESDDLLHCPVVQLHELRRSPDEKNYYGGHLAAFREIRDSLALVWRVESDEAHARYNHLLKTNPASLADALRAYAK